MSINLSNETRWKGILSIGATTAAMTALIAAPAAFADPEVELNSDSTPIPFEQIVNAGSSVDMTGITYTMTVAPQTYSGSLPTGTYSYAGAITNQPIVVSPAGTSTSGATTATTDDVASWNYTRTLGQMFGADAATNFPQAGMYEFSITETVSGGSSADTSKWTYDKPTYKLQVLVENTTENGEITGRHYAGWTLLELNESTGQYTKVNSGASGSDGKATFEADYSGMSHLNVSKVISGDYASTTYAFPIQVTLYLPSWAASSSITATDPSNQSITATSGVNTTTRVYDISLKHGETASFEVPVGTTYQIIEDPTHGTVYDAAGLEYAPSISWSVDKGPEPLVGSAYAVLTDSNDSVNGANKFVLFRSENTYTNGPNQTVTDIDGNTYVGNVYSGIENWVHSTSDNEAADIPWGEDLCVLPTDYVDIYVAPGQTIRPLDCREWFNNVCASSCNLTGLDTSNVTDMSGMFILFDASDSEIIGLGDFNTSNVTNMSHMFEGAYEMVSVDVADWDTSKVTDMTGLFNQVNGTGWETPDVSDWDVSHVVSMNSMLYYACTTTPDVSGWVTSSVTDMSYLFAGNSNAEFTAPAVANWDTSHVTSMYCMFDGCSGAGFTTLDISGWDTSSIVYASWMFSHCSNLTTIYVAPNTDWNASQTLTSHDSMFYDCSSLVGGNGTHWTSNYQENADKHMARVDGLGGNPGFFTVRSS